MHTVAIIALDGVIPFDLSTPIEVFTRAQLPDGRPGYQVRVCAEHPEIARGGESEYGHCDTDRRIDAADPVQNVKRGRGVGTLGSPSQSSGKHARGDGHRADRDDGCQDVQRQQEFGHPATLTARTAAPQWHL